jgi:hypothetical protein
MLNAEHRSLTLHYSTLGVQCSILKQNLTKIQKLSNKKAPATTVIRGFPF